MQRLLLLAKMMRQGSAACLALRKHHLDAAAVEKANGSAINGGRDGGIAAAAQQGTPASTLSARHRMTALRLLRRRHMVGGQRQQGRQRGPTSGHSRPF